MLLRESQSAFIYDIPGLGDTRPDMDEKILADMREVLNKPESKINVVILCFKMSESRLHSSLVCNVQEYNKIGVK